MTEDPNAAGSGPAPPPRRWEAPCPNCGAAVPFASPNSPYAVCGYCRSTVVRDGDSLKKIGESAELIDTRNRLQIGVRGAHAGRPFVLVGRVQYEYGEAREITSASLDGRWSEWHAAFDDGRHGWLSEDNDQYVMAFDRDDHGGAPPSGMLDFGGPLQLASGEWRVASIVHGRASAAEGELPSLPGLGDTRIIADLRNSQGQVATLDYQDPRTPTLSIGEPVRLAELQLQGLRDDAGLGVAKVGGRSFACPNCAATIEVQRDDTRSLSCRACHSVVDISAGIGGELRAWQQGDRYEPAIPLGSVGRLAFGGRPAVAWQVLGFSVKGANLQDPDEAFSWNDYLLHNLDEGFAFLVDSSEGWVAFRTLSGVPEGIRGGDFRDVSWQGRRYRLSERYTAVVQYVEGEFYWPLRRHQSTLTADYQGLGSASASRLSSETSDSEVIWSEGSVVPAEAVRKGFGLKSLPPKLAQTRHDIGPVSSDRDGSSSWATTLLWIVVIAAVIYIDYYLDDDDSYGGSGGYSYRSGGHK